jgi:hypothetical protein
MPGCSLKEKLVAYAYSPLSNSRGRQIVYGTDIYIYIYYVLSLVQIVRESK